MPPQRPDTDPDRYAVNVASPRRFAQAYVHEGIGGAGPLVLVHGWPESKRIFWKVIGPLADAGFEVIVPDLATPEQRLRYVAAFYGSRFWAHPGAFDPTAVEFHTEPFADADRLRATFRTYESVFDPDARSEPPLLASNPDVRCLILFGPSDHVLYPDFDRMAAVVFTDHVGPFLLRDCGHFVPWEAPHALVSATAAFCGDLLVG